MKKSRITFEVEQSRVETIVGLLIHEVSDFQVTEVHNEMPLRRSRVVKRDTYKKGNHPAMLSILEMMRTKPQHEWFYKDLGSCLAKHNMKATSITPLISELTAQERVLRTKRGYYKLA